MSEALFNLKKILNYDNIDNNFLDKYLMFFLFSKTTKSNFIVKKYTIIVFEKEQGFVKEIIDSRIFFKNIQLKESVVTLLSQIIAELCYR